MPMTPFVQTFPEIGAMETRTARVTAFRSLPEGEYGFLELYCDEPGCDCRRVFIQVLERKTGPNRILATINYGWESLAFYDRWGRGEFDPAELKGPCLAVGNDQSRYSEDLLDLFQSVVLTPEYIERLKRHYEMFRQAVEKPRHHKHKIAALPIGSRRRRR